MYDKIKLARADLAIDPIHDNRHELPNVQFARESIPYTLHLPDEGIAAFTYTWVNKAGEAGAALAIFGPGVGEEPIQQRLPDRKVPNDMDFSDWEIENYSLKQDLKFQHADVRWETEQATVEFSFDALHPPYAYGSHKDGCPSFTAINRIEQAGRAVGKFVIHGREVPFDAFAHRDHSWGTRVWGAFQHYNWFEGKSADGQISIHYWHYFALGRYNLRGYVCKEGVLAEITDIKTDVQFDQALWQQSMTTTVYDELGRTTSVTAEFYAHHPLIPEPEIELREGAARASYDGEDGYAWLEVCWPADYLKFVNKNGPLE